MSGPLSRAGKEHAQLGVAVPSSEGGGSRGGGPGGGGDGGDDHSGGAGDASPETIHEHKDRLPTTFCSLTPFPFF